MKTMFDVRNYKTCPLDSEAYRRFAATEKTVRVSPVVDGGVDHRGRPFLHKTETSFEVTLYDDEVEASDFCDASCMAIWDGQQMAIVKGKLDDHEVHYLDFCQKLAVAAASEQPLVLSKKEAARLEIRTVTSSTSRWNIMDSGW